MGMIREFRDVVRSIVMATLLAAVAPAQAREPRPVQSLSADWRFLKGDPADAAAPTLETKAWLKVTLPHTFNAGDGEDGGGYYRGPGWYRREIDLAPQLPGRRLFLQFDGAALNAEVFLNGTKVGAHAGGYAAFRFDITDLARPGRNLLVVRVDNAPTQDVAPLGGDFTVFGGLYRGVSILSTPALHIDALDHGGPGVYVSTPKVSADRAEVVVVTRVRDDGGKAQRARVTTEVLDAQGRVVAQSTSRVTTAPGGVTPVIQTIVLPRPRLWNGRKDPYLYQMRARVLPDGGKGGGEGPADEVSVPLGVRTFRVDPKAGFFLNGERLSLHGANLFHSGRPGKGLAVTDAEIDEDFQILEEMGATGLRLVHFQHPAHAYDRADRDGLVLWTEIPLNSKVDASPAFEANIVEQLRELIRQNFNHPSVMFWGLGNEIYASDAVSNRILARLQAEAKIEDPSRLTAYAHCCGADNAPHAMHTDVIAYNKYFGWYPDQAGEIGDWADKAHALIPDRAMAVSEYGAGGSILHQEDPPSRPDTASGWHPEQYQSLFHERAGRQLGARDYLWGQFVWVAFDLASDGRNEGDRPGINDKGLVTYDRRVRKDAYYWYQAAWSDTPMVHITSRRLTPRVAERVTVKIYSNAPRVRLTLDGVDQGAREVVDHIAAWPDVALKPGDNLVQVVSSADRSVQDSVVWTYEPPSAFPLLTSRGPKP
jgi:beta-galactosidase